jgi:hypothetical protein
MSWAEPTRLVTAEAEGGFTMVSENAARPNKAIFRFIAGIVGKNPKALNDGEKDL